eukprot:CAMPEP_0204843752 /NCGR_PEP_ID=MMETSP1346-20131115/48166_1 /ASSEMBLY_ACC=CAM_ASM_000771 /TAXON_ID=215587 /ORGANISM="Aplanochytrium stocchinoi, Strain GSBS06" /LENGTH=65 /DNA_ID=CAMNT_0051982953 /DNA_START=189 /DNA_END=386 /DNA_ORIENTATION=-
MTLQVLILEENKIGPSGTEHIANALKVNRSLQTLSLAGNGIGDKGAVAIANAIAENSNCALVRLK